MRGTTLDMAPWTWHLGHSTPEYDAAVGEADRLIGEIIQALQKA